MHKTTPYVPHAPRPAKRHESIDRVPKDNPPVHTHVVQHRTVVSRVDQQTPHLLHLPTHDQLTRADDSEVNASLPTTKMV
jgi:hypothetical protein